MAENIATLGFEFTIGNAESAINRIIKQLDELDEQSKKVMFGMDLMSSYTIESVERISKALQNIPAINNSVVTSVSALANAFRLFSTSTIGADTNIKKIFEALSTVPTVSDVAVTQFATMADKINSLSVSLKDEDVAKIYATFSALSALRPIDPAVATSLNSVCTGLGRLKVSDDVLTSLSAIIKLTTAVKPVDPTIASNIHNFVESINKIKPINATLPASIADFFNSFGNFNIQENIATQIDKMGEALVRLKGVNPEVTVAVRELIRVLGEAHVIDMNIVDTVNMLGEAIVQLKAINPKIAVSLRDIFNVLGEFKELDLNTITSLDMFAKSTVQFKVINPKVAHSIRELFETLEKVKEFDERSIRSVSEFGKATAQFKVINPRVSQSVRELFNTLKLVKQIPADISTSIKNMSEAIGGFKVVTKTVADNVERVFNLIANLKPIPADTIRSLNTLRDMFVAMANSGNNLITQNTRLNGSFRTLAGRADGTCLALRGLQSAISANFFIKAIHSSLDFARQLAYIKSIAQELNTIEIGKGLMNFSSVLGNVSENANALYYAYSSGIRGTEQELLKFTEIASKTAQVNRASLVPMINAMTAAMNAYKMNISETSEVADNFFAIVKYGKASGEQLANAYGQVSPTAKTLGLTLDELGASIASLTKVQPTRVAITGLNNMLSKIMKPTKESQLAMKKLGLDISYTAVQERGFTAVMNELHDALNGNKELLKNIIPDIRGQRAAMHLLGAGWTDWNIQLDNFANKKGSMEEAFSVLERDPSVQLGKIPETLKKISIEAGLMATKVLTLDGALTPLVQSFNNMDEKTRKLIASVLIAGSTYAVFKGIMLTITTLQAMVIRNQAIINAGKGADIVATKMQNAAAYGNAVAESKAAAAAVARAKASVITATNVLNSASATEAEALAYQHCAVEAGKYDLIKARNTLSNNAHNAVVTAGLKLQQAKIALMKAEETQTEKLMALEKARIALKAQETVSNTANTVANTANTASQTGNAVTNFVSNMILTKWVIDFGKTCANFVKSAKIVGWIGTLTAKCLAWAKGSAVMAGIVAKLGAICSTVGGAVSAVGSAIASVFSLVNVGVAGVIGVVLVAVDYLQSFIRTGTIANSITHKLMEGIVDWVTGASKGLKQADDYQKKLVGNLSAKKEFERASKENQDAINHLFDNWTKEKLPLDKFEQGRKAYNKALDEYNKTFRHGYVAIIAERKATQAEFDKIKLKNKDPNNKELKEAEEKLSEVNKKYEDFEKEAEAVRNRIQQSGNKMHSVITEQLNVIKSIQELVNNQNFKMSSPIEQYEKNMDLYEINMEKFNNAIKAKDYSAGNEAFKAMIGNYNQIRDFATKRIEENNRLNEQLSEMKLNALLQSTEDENKKIKLYEDKYKEFLKRSIQQEKEGDLSKSTESYKKAMDYANKMLSLRQKLAQAEDNANKRTMDLIKSMDKFQTTVQGAVEANSAEGFKLANRSFTAMPSFTSERSENIKMKDLKSAIIKSSLEFSTRMSKNVNSSSSEYQQDKMYYDKIWQEISKNANTNTGKVDTRLKEIIRQMTNGIKVKGNGDVNINPVQI